MNNGKYVFSQVMTYFPRWVFEAAVKKYNGDFHAMNLNSYSHYLQLMFGPIAGCKSLKDIALVLGSIKTVVYHLGITTIVDSSSLSQANKVRDYRIIEKLGMWLIRKFVRCTLRRISMTFIFPAGRSLQLTPQPFPAASSWLNGLLVITRKVVLRCILPQTYEEAY